MLMMPAIVFLCLLVMTACGSAVPVKEPVSAPTWMMPQGATLINAMPMTDGTVLNLYKIEDRCYLATTAGAALVSLGKTWCPDE
jgi:hypothetical protein